MNMRYVQEYIRNAIHTGQKRIQAAYEKEYSATALEVNKDAIAEFKKAHAKFRSAFKTMLELRGGLKAVGISAGNEYDLKDAQTGDIKFSVTRVHREAEMHANAWADTKHNESVQLFLKLALTKDKSGAIEEFIKGLMS